MAEPDVRIRLSAEGVAEVVAALKKIQTESVKTAEAPKKGFAALAGVLGGFRNVLSGIGIYLSARTLMRWGQAGLDTADQIGKLGERIGTTTERASALAWAARQSDTNITVLRRTAQALDKKLVELDQNLPAVVADFRQLGLSAKDFKGLDTAQAFALLASRIAPLRDGVQKTGIAVQLFGRLGTVLIPMLNRLGTTGLKGLVDQARELGLILDEDVANSVRAARMEMRTLAQQSDILGAQFAAGWAPALQQALKDVSGDIGKTGQTFKVFGQIAGKALQFLVALLGSLTDGLTSFIDRMKTGAEEIGIKARAIWEATKLASKGQFSEAYEALKRGDAEAEERWKAFNDRAEKRLERINMRWKDLFSAPPKAPDTGGGENEPGDDDTEERERLARERIELESATLNAELALYKAKAKLREEAEKDAWERGLTSLQDYFGKRRKAITDGTNAEIAILLKERALLMGEPDEHKRAQGEQKIDAKLAELRVERELALLKLSVEERKAVEELGKKRREIEQDIMEAQGRTHEAAMTAIAEELAQRDRELRQAGTTDAERIAVLQALRNAKTARADFEQARADADSAMADLDVARTEIQARVRAGQLTELQGEQMILEVEAARLGELERLAEALERAATATKDPELIRSAKEFAAALVGVGEAVSETQALLQHMPEDIRMGLTDDLSNWLATVGDEAETVSEAFQSLGRSILATIRRVTAEIMASKIIEWLWGVSGSIGAPKGLGGGTPYEPPVYGASGGLVRGPGTGTSDSILAGVSDYEFIEPASIVRRPGMLRFLETIRHGYTPVELRRLHALPSFAEGGLVGGGAPARATIDGSVTIGLEQGLVLRALDSPAGERLIVKTLARNRRALSRLW